MCTAATSHRCIALLERLLKKNICNLIVREHFADCAFPESLSYACIYWIEHVCFRPKKTDVMINLEFTCFSLSGHLLHWMEVGMSILKMSRRSTIRELRRLNEWIRPVCFRPPMLYHHIHFLKGDDHDRLSRLIADARRFSQFFADAIEEHPLLIYAMAVPLCPINTTIYELFHQEGMLRKSMGAIESGLSANVEAPTSRPRR